MPLFRRKKPRITLQQMLSARPVRLVEAPVKAAGEGKWTVAVPLRPAGWAKWFLRVPEGTTKTFELDALGLLVWELCDGKTSAQQIIRKLSKRYHLNVREAEVATLEFLRRLARKGLVGLSVKETGAAKGGKQKG